MSVLQANVLTVQEGQSDALARVAAGLARQGAAREAGATHREYSLGCVWTGFPSSGWTCHSRIPMDVVLKAWQAELEASGEREDRFFHFIWQGGVWRAYGLKDGRVRGVYCPSHNSERAERSHAALCGCGDDVYDLPIAA